MTKAKLIVMMVEYRSMCARIDVLTQRIVQAERWMDMHDAAYIEAMQLSRPQITDMPVAHGGNQSPTERTAITIMDDRIDGSEARGYEQDVRELNELRARKRHVDALLSALYDRERFVVTMHLIGGLKWRETGRRFAAEYGEELTEGALQAIMKKGLGRMLAVENEA